MGVGVQGIDCTAEVVAHERYHQWVYFNWLPGGFWESQYGPHSSHNDRDGDWLPNEYESTVSNTDPDNSDTHRVARIMNRPDIYEVGDQEYMAMLAGNGMTGDPQRDWSAGLYSKQWP